MNLRDCPLLQLAIGCSVERPWCGWCASRPERRAEAAVQPAPLVPQTPPARPRPRLKRKPCAACRAYFQPGSPRETFCDNCKPERIRAKNREHQRAWRERKARRKLAAAKRHTPGKTFALP